MPTENRSSNPEMVSVPEGFMLVERSIWTEQQVEAATACITRLKGVPGMRDCDLAMAAIDAAQCKAPDIALSDLLPAQQPHPDPIAWMVGTAFWWTKEEAERDAAETGLTIVELGPMTESADIDQLQLEIAELQLALTMHDDAAIQDACIRAENSKLHAKLAEMTTYRDNAANHMRRIRTEATAFEKERDALRAQLAEAQALLREAACHATRMEPISASCLNRIDTALDRKS